MTTFRLATVVDALHTLSGDVVRDTSDANSARVRKALRPLAEDSGR